MRPIIAVLCFMATAATAATVQRPTTIMVSGHTLRITGARLTDLDCSLGSFQGAALIEYPIVGEPNDIEFIDRDPAQAVVAGPGCEVYNVVAVACDLTNVTAIQVRFADNCTNSLTMNNPGFPLVTSLKIVAGTANDWITIGHDVLPSLSTVNVKLGSGDDQLNITE